MSYVAAYRQSLHQNITPVDAEHQVMVKVTAALEKATDVPSRNQALSDNMAVWNALASDLVTDSNQLPVQMRAQLLSLSIWVQRHTQKVIRREADVQALVDVNRAIVSGLEQARRNALAREYATPAPAPHTADAVTAGHQRLSVDA